MATSVRTYDNPSTSGNAKAHFGDSYTGDHRSYSHGLYNNQGSININYAADADVSGAERNRRLLEAAAEKQTPRVEALLKLKADVEFRDEQGLTALHHAVLSGHGDVVRLILRHGADINSRTAKMGPPLCLAALKGDLCTVQILLDAWATVDLFDGPLGTALHCACYNGNLAVARALVERGALLDRQCPLDFEQLKRFSCSSQSGSLASFGTAQASTVSGEAGSKITETWSPLLLAVRRRSSGVLRLLLEAGCQVDRSCGTAGLTSLMMAARCGNVTEGRMLMQNNANVNTHDCGQRTALHHASEHGHLTFVKLLLGGPAHLEALDATNRTPILVAAANKQTAIVRLLAIHGANLLSADGEGNTLLHFAMQRKDNEMAQILADEATKRLGPWRSRLFLSTFDATAKRVFECIVAASEASSPERLDPIHIAAQRGLSNAIPVLHLLGARATHTDGQAWTAAHHAAQSGSLQAFKHVLELGVILDAPTNQRETALAIAARAGHSQIVFDALKRGADPDVRNSLGLTPLHLSAGSGRAKTVQILISKAVNPLVKSIAGDSALHYASRGGHSLLFPALLSKGLDPNIPNNAGRTALDDAVDAKTRGALLACYQSGILSAHATQALAVRAAPGPAPVTTLTVKSQDSDPAPMVHNNTEPSFFDGLAALIWIVVVLVVCIIALPAIIVACLQILGCIAVLGTFWAVMPSPSTVGAGNFSDGLLAIVEGFWKIFIICCSLFMALIVSKISGASGLATICMLCAFPWLGFYWWAFTTANMAHGPAYLIYGLVCLSMLRLLYVVDARQEKSNVQTVAKIE